MLRAFSSIRKTLINEGKTSRYVRYAVGEFLLIVAGILVALQIQNWNNARIERALEQTYITRLIEDVETDILEIQRWIEFGEMRMGFVRLLIESVSDLEVASRRPVEYIAAFKGSASLNTVNLQANTFEELRSSGLLRLLENQELKRQLLGYHNYDQWVSQYTPLRQFTQQKYLDLISGILTPDQKLWYVDEVRIMSPRKLETIDRLPMDKSWAIDAARRVQENTALASHLPEMLSMHDIHIAEHSLRLKRAEALLEVLKSEMEEGD